MRYLARLPLPGRYFFDGVSVERAARRAAASGSTAWPLYDEAAGSCAPVTLPAAAT